VSRRERERGRERARKLLLQYDKSERESSLHQDKTPRAAVPRHHSLSSVDEEDEEEEEEEEGPSSVGAPTAPPAPAHTPLSDSSNCSATPCGCAGARASES
jgi:hypothetical protein